MTGWDWFEPDTAAKENDAGTHWQTCFASDAGQQVLRDLETQFVRSSLGPLDARRAAWIGVANDTAGITRNGGVNVWREIPVPRLRGYRLCAGMTLVPYHNFRHRHPREGGDLNPQAQSLSFANLINGEPA